MAGEKVVKDGEIVDTDDDVTDITDDDIIDDDVTDDDPSDDDVTDDDPSDDDDPNKKVVKEPWMADEDDSQPSDVPVSTHIKMKQKLKGRISQKDEELERLRQENLQLKAGTAPLPVKKAGLPKRPHENDFDTLVEYEEALGEYEQKMVDIRLENATRRTQLQQAQQQAKTKLDKAVDGHYSRAAKLIQDNGIDTEVYKQTDLIVREAIETLMPGRGDITTDQMISVIGEGSEKVLYYLGRNKNALNELRTLLVDDPTGLKATIFLGQQRERLVNQKRRASGAPSPGRKVRGDKMPTSAKANSLLKKRKAALKAGNIQRAYDIKKQAKEKGVDVSDW